MPRLACLLLLASTGLTNASEWEGDLAKAKARAKKENKPVFVVFRCEH
jgi:hypothetical protein